MAKKRVLIAADHAGFSLKEKIKDERFDDLSPVFREGDDFPEVASRVAQIAMQEQTKAVLICSSGIGMSIAANKVRGCRAAVCRDVGDAVMARRDNDANVLCLGGHVTSKNAAKSIVDAFLATPFAGRLPGGKRFKRRVEEIGLFETFS